MKPMSFHFTNTPSLIFQFVLIVTLLNYFALKEERAFNSILSQDYRSGKFDDEQLIKFDGIKYIEHLFVFIMSSLALNIYEKIRIYLSKALLIQSVKQEKILDPDQQQIKIYSKVAQKFKWEQLILGLVYFIGIKSLSLSDVNFTNSGAKAIIRAINILFILVFIHYIMNNKQFLARKINFNDAVINSQKQILSRHNIIASIFIIGGATVNVIFTKFDIMSVRSVLAVESVFSDGPFIVAIIMDYVIFGVMFWIKNKYYDQVNALHIMIALTKFSCILFGISGLINGQLLSMMNQIVNYPSLWAALGLWCSTRLVYYFLLMYSLINYPLLVFFTIYSSRKITNMSRNYWAPVWLVGLAILIIGHAISCRGSNKLQSDKTQASYQIIEQDEIKKSNSQNSYIA